MLKETNTYGHLYKFVADMVIRTFLRKLKINIHFPIKVYSYQFYLSHVRIQKARKAQSITINLKKNKMKTGSNNEDRKKKAC